MKEKRATLEVIAPTIEEAIEKGLTDLGLPSEAVDVEILDQGSRGIFGLGSRQARVRLTVKAQQPDVDQSKAPEAFEKEAFSGEAIDQDLQLAEVEELEERRIEGQEQDLTVARETVQELLEKMKIRARVTAQYGKPDEERGRIPIWVDIRGDDLGILIGRRAEVLNALQFITGLIVSKELGHSVSLVVDVEGYRIRREGQLRQLARRMADQAVKTGRRQVLEPMSASERRIIHMELRDHPNVRTESVGEEPRRKVTILLKEE